MDLNVRLSASLSLLVSLRALSFEIFSFAFFLRRITRGQTVVRTDGRTVLEQSIQVFFRIVARVLYYVHACTGVVLGFRFKSFLSRKKWNSTNMSATHKFSCFCDSFHLYFDFKKFQSFLLALSGHGVSVRLGTAHFKRLPRLPY